MLNGLPTEAIGNKETDRYRQATYADKQTVTDICRQTDACRQTDTCKQTGTCRQTDRYRQTGRAGYAHTADDVE